MASVDKTEFSHERFRRGAIVCQMDDTTTGTMSFAGLSTLSSKNNSLALDTRALRSEREGILLSLTILMGYLWQRSTRTLYCSCECAFSDAIRSPARHETTAWFRFADLVIEAVMYIQGVSEVSRILHKFVFCKRNIILHFGFRMQPSCTFLLVVKTSSPFTMWNSTAYRLTWLAIAPLLQRAPISLKSKWNCYHIQNRNPLRKHLWWSSFQPGVFGVNVGVGKFSRCAQG